MDVFFTKKPHFLHKPTVHTVRKIASSSVIFTGAGCVCVQSLYNSQFGLIMVFIALKKLVWPIKCTTRS
jgi:hypothetical protein